MQQQQGLAGVPIALLLRGCVSIPFRGWVVQLRRNGASRLGPGKEPRGQTHGEGHASSATSKFCVVWVFVAVSRAACKQTLPHNLTSRSCWPTYAG
eukprot:1160054-Pelagomonas_calceolata.AAC.5